MRKIFLLVLSASFLLFSMVYGQSLKLISGDSLLKGSADGSFESHLLITNISSKTITVVVERTKNDTAAHHESYFCWGSCYSPATSRSSDLLEIKPGDTIDGFKGYLNTYGYAGVSVIDYCFYDNDNSNDKLCQSIRHEVSEASTGINDLYSYSKGSRIYQLSPNPVTDNASVKYSLRKGFKSAQLRVINVLGNTIQSEIIEQAEGVVDLRLNNLSPGIYLYMLTVDGSTVGTRKFIKN